jgi:CHAP domain/Putative peptidoglycan binding domain
LVKQGESSCHYRSPPVEDSQSSTELEFYYFYSNWRIKAMTTINQVLQIAQRELGVKETGDNINKYAEWYDPDLNGQSWCAIFVSYCLYKAGLQVQIETDKGFHYTPNGSRWFKEQNRWFKDPLPGDIVFFDWQNEKDDLPGAANHVAFFVARTQDNRIITIDGNSPPDDESNSGQVRYKVRNFNHQIMGFGRPAYSNIISTAIPLLSNISTSYLITVSEDIEIWQQIMIARGYDFGGNGADGIFGRCSKQVLEEFQQKLGFKVNGVLDVLSWQAAWTAI